VEVTPAAVFRTNAGVSGVDACSHWRRAQSARAGGPRGRADRAKSTSRRTYCARNLVVSEFSPAAQSLETSGFCRSDAVTTQPPPGPPVPSSGRCAKCLKGGTGRAPHRAPQAEPGADCPFALAVRSETMRPRLVRFCCVNRRARISPCSAGADCGDSFPSQELMRSSSQRRRNLSVRETDFHSRGTPACESREKPGTALRG
jgi:hypothetical protein